MTAANLAAVQADEFCCCLSEQRFAVSHEAFLGTAAASDGGSCGGSCPAVAVPRPQRTAALLKDVGFCSPSQ